MTTEIERRPQPELRRYAQLAGGGLLALYGLRRGGWLGLTAMVAGGAVAAATARGLQQAQQSHAEAAITIDATPDELYRRWRALNELPTLLAHVREVRDLGDGRSEWKARGPGGYEVSWTAEITEDKPGECLAWRSLPEADVPSEGEVRFRKAPGDRGTEVIVRLRYGPPFGRIGAMIAGLAGKEPGQTLASDLRRFKQLIEVGEVLTTRGQPAARADSVGHAGELASRVTHAARQLQEGI